MNVKYKNDILSMFTDELGIYKVILSKTTQQMDAIKSLDVSQLQAILQEKDACIHRIESIEKRIAPLLAHMPQASYSDREIRSCLRNIEETIKDIIKMEEACYTTLSVLHKDMAEEILQANKGIQTAKAYNPSLPSVPRFFDIRS